MSDNNVWLEGSQGDSNRNASPAGCKKLGRWCFKSTYKYTVKSNVVLEIFGAQYCHNLTLKQAQSINNAGA